MLRLAPTLRRATDVSDPDSLSQRLRSRRFAAFERAIGDRKEQEAMASEVRRVATAHWIQSPNFWFPMEPHFLLPGWQWLPEDMRVAILQRREVGHFGRSPAEDDARRVVRGTQLLTRRQLQSLFPESLLVPERYGCLVKSWTAVGGLGHRRARVGTR